MKHSFFLVIPRQQNNPQRLKEFEEKILQQWISELPVANPGLATRLIYDFILEFNALAMPNQLRLDTLELLRPSLLAIEDYLRSKLIKTDFPKEVNDQKVLKLLVAVQRQFTIGYWIVVKELTEREISWFKSKNVALAIQRSIKEIGNIIISYFTMGMVIPDWIWMDLHSLHKLSVKIKKNTTQVATGNINSTNKTSSPEECYLVILLLSLAEPSGLMQKEIRQVCTFIQTIHSLVSLKTTPVANQPKQCIILVDEDKPPYFQSQSTADNIADGNGNAVKLYIDFTKFFQALAHKKIAVNTTKTRFSARHELNDSNEDITLELLQYLQQRWAGISLQSAAIFSDRLDRYIAIGLAASFNLQTSAQLTENDQELLVHSVSNQSLSCVFKKTGILSIGSLISFRKIDEPEHKRTLGIVNRLIVGKENGQISFGLQLLTNRFISVHYSKFDHHENGHFKNALMYKSEEQKEKNYIIMDTFIYKDGDIVQLSLNHEEFPILLKDKKNIALGYWQFECLKVLRKDPQHY